MKRFAEFTILLAFFLAGCAPIIPASGNRPTPVVITAAMSTVIAETPGPPSTEGPSPTTIPATPIPSLPAASLSPTELKYKVLAQFPDFFFCDPDFYTELSGSTTFTDDQKLTIYREHKKINAIYFELIGDRYQFQIQTGLEGQQGDVINGTIDGNGSIDVLERNPGFPTCPICLAAGILIDTPNGAVAVENLEIGDSVWTMNEAGERVTGTILEVGSIRVPSTHHVIHILLSDGRELWASPGHPTADGRTLRDLKTGDGLDGAQIILMERLPYNGVSTYDLLPSGSTGFYWANGLLMDSTLQTHGIEK
jgi:hypothetical protein